MIRCLNVFNKEYENKSYKQSANVKASQERWSEYENRKKNRKSIILLARPASY